MTERSSNSPHPAHARTVAQLALSDVCHEWRMSLCMMLAVAAISTPLLLFFGLKNGTIDTLRTRLLNNPVNLEIVPNTEKLLSPDWFDALDADPLVGFVVPHTRKLSAQADIRTAGSRDRLRRVDIRPTEIGDTLLLRYGLPIPSYDECILTEPAAKRVGLHVGETVEFTVTRDRGREKAVRLFKVAGILPIRASALPTAYIRLSALENIENYKDGRAVPAWGWLGNSPTVNPAFSSVTMKTKRPLTPTEEVLALENTGFATIEEIDSKVYQIAALGSFVDTDNVKALEARLQGAGAVFIPAVKNVTLTFKTAEGKAVRVSPESAVTLNTGRRTDWLYPMPQSEKKRNWSEADSRELDRVPLKIGLAPTLIDAVAPGALTVTATAQSDDVTRSVVFPVEPIPVQGLSDNIALMPVSLLGTVNMLNIRSVHFERADEHAPRFLLGRRGYSGFRLYAKDLDDVAPLADKMEKAGIKATTRADRIAEVKTMDYYLTLLFWLIAAASVLGGIACLVANMVANVERKKRDLAVLRLLGVHGLKLTVFPLISVTALCTGGMLMALGLYHGMAFLINTMFASQLEAGEAFCRLSLEDQTWAVLLALLVGLLAAIGAAKRLLSIEPSDSLRDE